MVVLRFLDACCFDSSKKSIVITFLFGDACRVLMLSKPERDVFKGVL